MKNKSLVRIRTLALALAFAASAPLFAADPAPTVPAPAAAKKEATPKTPADLAWDEVMALFRVQPMDAMAVMNAAFDTAAKFPEVPRSGMTVSGLDGLDFQMKDEAAKTAYQAALGARIAAALAIPGLPDAMKTGLMAADYAQVLTVQKRATKPEAAAVRAKIDALAAAFPKARQLAAAELAYGDLLAKADPVAGEDHLKKLAAGPDEALAKQAADQLRVTRMRSKPVELKFTAADGREVDLAALRGKVVLIDFWATWCGPCIAELPSLTRVYNEYHAKGFEVIGISFENSGIVDEAALKNPRNAGKAIDTPEQIAGKKAAAKAKMLAFTKDKAMPWPQHFDGDHWNNEFGRKYNIRSIPAMFLINKEGLLVETSARGEKLEPLVKQLLGL